MTESQRKAIIDFCTTRGIDEVGIEEMLEWCEFSGATTIQQVHDCGYDWDWWDKDGHLTWG